MTTPTRADDERLLGMLHARNEGRTAQQIAYAIGHAKSQYVSTATTRVMRDDLAMSGEPEATVRRAYGWAR